jgi:hypothetical protein
MSTPAGWYPQNDGQQRYWDGQQWTEHFAPGAQGAPGAPGAEGGAVPGVTAPKAKRAWYVKKRVLIPAGVLVLAMIGGAMGGGDDPTTPVSDSSPTSSAKAAIAAPAATKSAAPTTKAAAPKPAPKPAPPVSQIGKPFRDGKFKFTVRSVKCGIAKVGDSVYLQKKAQGQFCAVTMSIENIGDEAQSMFADNQVAFDTKGRKFSADSEASIYDDSSQVLYEEINPGNSVKGKVYFDIPKGAKLTSLELHDSAFSGGVKVHL